MNLNLLRFEQGALERNGRMRIIICVLLQQPVFYKRRTLKKSQFQIINNTRDSYCLVYGGKYNISVMANPQTKSYSGKFSGNILVLGSSASGKTTLVQEMASSSMFGKLEEAHWISAVKLSKKKRLR